MRATLLGSHDPRWKRLISRVPHQFYQDPRYVELEAARVGGEARAVVVEGDGCVLLMPLVFVFSTVGVNGPEVLDAFSPYGYPGMLVECRGNEEASVRKALEAARSVLDDAGISGVFVRLDPLSDVPDALAHTGTLVEHGTCTWLDLTLPMEELDRHLRPRYRSYIRAMRRDGVTARFDEDFEHLDVFVDLYHRTMDAVGAARMYYLRRSYFDGLRAILGNSLKLCLVEHQGGVTAAGLFAESGGIVQYLFSGKDDECGVAHATKLMMVHVRDWAKAAGRCRAMHLGGGVGGRDGDSLSRFKRGFSKLTRPFYSWRWVVNGERFRKATEAWEELSGQVAEDMEGYFPPYRKPIGEVAPDGQADVDGA